MNITYRHAGTGEEVIYTAPVPGLEASAKWQRVEGPSYAKLLKPALVDLCEQRSLDASGTVPELRSRLEAYDAEHAGEQ